MRREGKVMSMPPPPLPPLSHVPPAMSPFLNPAVVDAQGMLKVDTPCRKCGYNLRGLSVNGRCPECGTPVGLSVMGDLLRFSDPAWIRTLRRGITLILAGIVALIFGMVAVSIVMGAKGRAGLPLAVVVNFAGYGLMLVGGWLLTEPDPSGVGEDQYGTSRRIIRFSLAVGAANSLISWISQMQAISPAVRISIQIINGVASLVALVGQFAQLNYLSKLSRRIPDVKLAGRARFLMYAIGISYGLVVVFGILMAIAVATRGRGGGAIPLLAGGGLFVMIAGLALIVFGLMYLDLLEKLRKRLREQIAAAESTWAAGTVAAAQATA